MQPLDHLVEPTRLLMTWQSSDEHPSARVRRVIGEVVREGTDHKVVFRYLKGTEDYAEAEKAGFKGFPAFHSEQPETRDGVLDSLIRRLPPRNREDFREYLAKHGLSAPFELSDFALLGYTGARLPSDGFALVPEFDPDARPCEYVMEVAGTRHVFKGSIDELRPGDPVSIELDVGNPVDADALVVVHEGRRIGYVNRALRHMIHVWLRSGSLVAAIHRLNGNQDRPLVYVRISRV